MQLDLACINDVHDFDTAHFEIIGDQRTMTAPPNRLCTHDCGPSDFVRKIEKTLNAFVKLFCFHIIGVTAK